VPNAQANELLHNYAHTLRILGDLMGKFLNGELIFEWEINTYPANVENIVSS
jgi:hypothetical protein